MPRKGRERGRDSSEEAADPLERERGEETATAALPEDGGIKGAEAEVEAEARGVGREFCAAA